MTLDAPRTAAGRRMLDDYERWRTKDETCRAILAIEAEAATLDVKRLGLALTTWHHESRVDVPDKWAEKAAEIVAAEYGSAERGD